MINDYSDLEMIYLYHPIRFLIGVEIYDKRWIVLFQNENLIVLKLSNYYDQK